MGIKDGLELVKKFVEENIERDVRVFETNEDIYKSYKAFCRNKEIEPMTIVSLGHRLNFLNIGVKHKKMVNYKFLYGRQGVRLK